MTFSLGLSLVIETEVIKVSVSVTKLQPWSRYSPGRDEVEEHVEGEQ